MGKLTITDDGKQSVNHLRSIYKAVLVVLNERAMEIRELVITIKRQYEEFKYLNVSVVIKAVTELVKQKLVVSSYRWE